MKRDTSRLFIGIDVGTSGCRACAIDVLGQCVDTSTVDFSGDDARDPQAWWQAVRTVLRELLSKIDRRCVAAIAVDGTSGTVLLADHDGQPLAPPLMYSDARAKVEAELIARHAPRDSAAHGATSSLAKLLWLQEQTPAGQARYVLHQADWIMGRLCGRFGVSDENNCLKLGYDPVARGWPTWLEALGVELRLLPRAYPPGTPIGTIKRELAAELRLPAAVEIITGTTDSIAAFIVTGATQVGDAVTSLGSTLVLKIIIERPICAPEYGVYSHRLGDSWLVGGASNSGGAVLQQFFSQTELDAMTPKLKPDEPTGLDYYPLAARGERFPRSDPDLAPRLEPRPRDPARFFQGMLEGIAAIEREGYERLHALGAPYPTGVYCMGRGANNAAWTRIRQRLLNVEVTTPAHTDAAYGTALLARKGIVDADIRRRGRRQVC